MPSWPAGSTCSMPRRTTTSPPPAGGGGHEVRTWVATLAALGAGYAAEELFYEPIDEWIAGMGLLCATAA